MMNGRSVHDIVHGNTGLGGEAMTMTTMTSSAELPDEIELRYRLYAVTDVDGKADTTDDRRIARAASEVATRQAR